MLINNFPFISKLLTYSSDLLESRNSGKPDPKLCTYYPVKYTLEEVVHEIVSPTPDVLEAHAVRFIKLSRIDDRGVVIPTEYAALDEREKQYAVGIYSAHRGVEVNAKIYNGLRDKVVGYYVDVGKKTNFKTKPADFLAMVRKGDLAHLKVPSTVTWKGLWFTDGARDMALKLIAEKKRFVWDGRRF